MIKNKVLFCSLGLTVLATTKLYISKTEKSDEVSKIEFVQLKEEKISTSTNSTTKELYWKTVNFANEEVPVELPTVKAKLTNHLSKFSYQKLQSYAMHQKADRYLPQIAEILLSYGIPEDFKYIPIVESGLNPKTKSHKGAGGYWQFIPSTARLHGLKVNDKVDERLDLVKSTHAAAKYIKYLYREFGDWTLVAAAYNVGGGSLRRSIRNQGTANYYKLKLNKETGSYVYKIVSVKEVIENPARFGYNRLAHVAHSSGEMENIM